MAQTNSFEFGDGTQDNPYQIENWLQLDQVRLFPNAHFILVQNLSETTTGYIEYASSTANTGKGWLPIGDNENPFQGSFNGNAKIITGLNINRPNQSFIGLFGFANNASVKNLLLQSVEVTGGDYTGSLIGYSRNTQSSSIAVNTTLVGSSNVGGLIGFQSGNLALTTSCTVDGIITGDTSVGGLIGKNYGAVKSSSTNVVITGIENTGGLVGLNQLITDFDVLILKSGQGEVSISPNQTSYEEQTSLSVTATPDTGWVFEEWTEDIESNTNPYNFEIDSDKTIKANFIKPIYTITLNPSPGAGGTEFVTVAYGDPMPDAEAPTPDEQLGVFLGYYTQENGGGDQYYDANMNSTQTWNLEEDTTLFAFWFNFCEDGPCQNGGTCTNDQDNLTFKCECPELYTGNRCEFLDGCVVYANANNGNSPCANGDCVSDDGGILCECNQGSACACCDGFDFPGFSCAAQGKSPTGSFCIEPSEITDMALLENDNDAFKNYTRFVELRQRLMLNNSLEDLGLCYKDRLAKINRQLIEVGK